MTVVHDLLGFGLRSHGAAIAHHLFLRFDLFAVNALVGTAGVGFYSLATSLAEKFWIPLDAIASASQSRIAQLAPTDSALLTARMSRAALLLELALASPFALASPWLIPFLYTRAFEPTVLPLIVLLTGMLGFAVMTVLNNYIVGQMQRPGLLSIISWLQLAVSIPLYMALILWQGIVGAAIASTLTYLLAMAGSIYLFVRDSGVPMYQVVIPSGADLQMYAGLLRSTARWLRVLRHARPTSH